MIAIPIIYGAGLVMIIKQSFSNDRRNSRTQKS